MLHDSEKWGKTVKEAALWAPRWENKEGEDLLEVQEQGFSWSVWGSHAKVSLSWPMSFLIIFYPSVLLRRQSEWAAVWEFVCWQWLTHHNFSSLSFGTCWSKKRMPSIPYFSFTICYWVLIHIGISWYLLLCYSHLFSSYEPSPNLILKQMNIQILTELDKCKLETFK